MTAIDVENVTKRYGDVTALDGVSLTVERGETVGLVGTNGAGKTTLFSLLVAHDRPDAGRVRVAGIEPGDGTRVRREVGYLPEDAGFRETLTGREVLRFHATVRGVPEDELDRRVARALATVGLADDADRRTGAYSNGMVRRLGLATCLLTRPTVLLLDEPTAGLDPVGVEAFDRVVEGVQELTDVAVVVSTHVLSEAERLCDRVVVLDDGRVRDRGEPAALARAVDDTVTIEATLTEGADPGAVVDACDAHPAAAVTVEGRDVTIRSPGEDAGDVVTALHEATDVARFEVHEPDLAAAFRAAVEPAVDVSVGEATDAASGDRAVVADATNAGSGDRGERP